MNKYFFLPVVLLLLLSCKMITSADKQFATADETKLYHLRLNPGAGSAYSYEMTSQYEMKLEVDDKKIDNLNKTTTVFF